MNRRDFLEGLLAGVAAKACGTTFPLTVSDDTPLPMTLESYVTADEVIREKVEKVVGLLKENYDEFLTIFEGPRGENRTISYYDRKINRARKISVSYEYSNDRLGNNISNSLTIIVESPHLGYIITFFDAWSDGFQYRSNDLITETLVTGTEPIFSFERGGRLTGSSCFFPGCGSKSVIGRKKVTPHSLRRFRYMYEQVLDELLSSEELYKKGIGEVNTVRKLDHDKIGEDDYKPRRW